VGQRPFEMGEKSMDTLLALHDGKPVQEINYTGVDRVTKTMSESSSNSAAQAAGASFGMAAFHLLRRWEPAREIGRRVARRTRVTG